MLDKVRERNVEKEVTDYAKRNGTLTYKFTSPGHRGIPDRIFIRSGRVMFVEFKARTGRLSESQNSCFNTMRDHGVKVHLVYDIEAGKHLIDQMSNK